MIPKSNIAKNTKQFIMKCYHFSEGKEGWDYLRTLKSKVMYGPWRVGTKTGEETEAEYTPEVE